MRRRFPVGYDPTRHFNFGLMDLRVVQGDKALDDRRLDLRCPVWQPIKMALGCLLSDFFFENEQVLYPPTPNGGRGKGVRGGQYYLAAANEAAASGWLPVAERIETERSFANGHAPITGAATDDKRKADYELEPHPAGIGWTCPCCGEPADTFFGLIGDRLCRRCDAVRRYLRERASL